MNCSSFRRALIIAFSLSTSPKSFSEDSSIAAVLVGVFALFPAVSSEPNGEQQVIAATNTAPQQCLESGESTCGAGISRSDDSSSSSSSESSQPTTTTTIITNPDGHTLISHSELAAHITIENRIWLSILGKVYDVTEGDAFYGFTKGSYKFYAGRDASPCFATGNNTPEGADEKIEDWTDNSKLIGLYEWALFYDNHETYRFVGVLADSRYYDAQGVETSLRRDFISRASAAKEIVDAEREKKKKERMERKMERRKKLYG